MTNNNSLTLFDQLATEIIFEIFDYLSCNDIIYAFFDFNQRFNSILLQHQQFSYKLELPIENLYAWQNILPIIGSQIQHLTITTIDFDFSLKLFSNLKSLIIDSPFPVNYELLYSILESIQFNKLNSFKIKSEIFHKIDHYGELEEILFKNIFHNENSLEIFEYLSKLHISFFFKNINNRIINVNIYSLSLKLINFNDVFSLLDYTPNVKYLNLIVTSFCEPITYLDEELILFKINLEKFDFTYAKDDYDFFLIQEYFISLKNLIKKFSLTLIYLSIDLSQTWIMKDNTFQFDGIILQQNLLQSMIKLKTFHFYARLNQRPNNFENFLLTFKNQFWFDHNWSIGMHEKYLYTLPFHFNKFNDFIDFDHMESNNLLILNSPSTWYHVKSIDLPECSNLNSNLIKQIKLKMPNLITITFSPISGQYIDTIEDEMNITLDRVTTVCFSGNNMNRIKQWLTYILPNLKYLILSYTNKFIPIVNERIERLKIINGNALDKSLRINDVYFPNVKHIEIKLDHYRSYDVMRVLKSFKNLKTLMFYFRWYGYNYKNLEAPDFGNMFGKLNLIEILENYQIKYGCECYQFIKKKPMIN